MRFIPSQSFPMMMTMMTTEVNTFQGPNEGAWLLKGKALRDSSAVRLRQSEPYGVPAVHDAALSATLALLRAQDH